MSDLNEENAHLRKALITLRRSCRELVQAMASYQMDVDEEPTWAHRAMMERAHAAIALSEIDNA